MATGTAIVDFGAGATEASIAVSVPTITATSQVGVGLRSEATAVNSVDDIYLDPVEVYAIGITAGVGFTAFAKTTSHMAFGTYKIDWATT